MNGRIQVQCPRCGKAGTVPEQYAGKEVGCKCGSRIAVSSPNFSFDEPSQPAMVQQVVIHNHRSFPHAMHGVLTLLTCGFWLPIWVICYLMGGGR